MTGVNFSCQTYIQINTCTRKALQVLTYERKHKKFGYFKRFLKPSDYHIDPMLLQYNRLKNRDFYKIDKDKILCFYLLLGIQLSSGRGLGAIESQSG
jgi:hypothetical protein